MRGPLDTECFRSSSTSISSAFPCIDTRQNGRNSLMESPGVADVRPAFCPISREAALILIRRALHAFQCRGGPGHHNRWSANDLLAFDVLEARTPHVRKAPEPGEALCVTTEQCSRCRSDLGPMAVHLMEGYPQTGSAHFRDRSHPYGKARWLGPLNCTSTVTPLFTSSTKAVNGRPIG